MTPGMRTTDALIAELSLAAPPRRLPGVLVLGAVLVALGLGAAWYFLSMGARPDLAAVIGLPIVQAKTILPALLFAMAMPLALRLMRPEARLRLWPLVLPAAVAAGLFLLSLPGVPEGGLGRAIAGETRAKCLTFVTLLSVLPLAVGLGFLRRGASVRPTLSGALLGLACGTAATAAYSISCAEDSPLFFVTWYGIAIMIVTAVGALLGRWLLRW